MTGKDKRRKGEIDKERREIEVERQVEIERNNREGEKGKKRREKKEYREGRGEIGRERKWRRERQRLSLVFLARAPLSAVLYSQHTSYLGKI